MKSYAAGENWEMFFGDCRRSMALCVPDKSVQMCVTSPPYYGLRDYGVDGQLGLEATPEAYVAAMVEVFREVRRCLKDDGVLWLNIGDSYAANRSYQVNSTKGGPKHGESQSVGGKGSVVPDGLKPKDLIGIPWLLAFALRADGWYLRQDIIWAKPNPMPESVTDRCTKSHEYVFMLSKSQRYYYNHHAIKTPMKEESRARLLRGVSDTHKNVDGAPGQTKHTMNQPREHVDKQRGHSRRHAGFNERWDGMTKEEQQTGGANKRSVWNIATKPYKGAHFATFPPELITPPILATSRPGDLVLDPFMGSGTTAQVALSLGRRVIGCELNESYLPLIQKRIDSVRA